jgi:hypothetical protein
MEILDHGRLAWLTASRSSANRLAAGAMTALHGLYGVRQRHVQSWRVAAWEIPLCAMFRWFSKVEFWAKG